MRRVAWGVVLAAVAAGGMDMDDCGAGAPTVVVPAVWKGLANQRMRIVQDVAMASLLGFAVSLPAALHGRSGCHYRADCYRKYDAGNPTWSVFDENATVAALTRAGVCVRAAAPAFAAEAAVVPFRWPLAASDVVLSRGVVRRHVAGLPNASRVQFGDPRHCCTHLVPDSPAAAKLVREVHAAFAPAATYSSLAARVLGAFRKAAVGGGEVCVAHWRDEDDFAASEHALDRAAYAARAGRG